MDLRLGRRKAAAIATASAASILALVHDIGRAGAGDGCRHKCYCSLAGDCCSHRRRIENGRCSVVGRPRCGIENTRCDCGGRCGIR